MCGDARDEAAWELLQVGDEVPEPRVAASLTALPSGQFLMHGGWQPSTDRTFDEPYILKL